MKNLFVLVILFTTGLAGCVNSGNDSDEPGTVKNQKTLDRNVAMLGVFHFGSTGDVAAVKVDNILGKRRQKEIDTILTRLESYQPDKVMVEYPYSHHKQLNEEYHKYLEGSLELEKNEIHQLGFKLAERLEHDSVYAIDYELSIPFNELMEYAKTHGREKQMDRFVKNLRDRAERKSEYLEKHSIQDYLTALNTDSSDLWNKNLYIGEILAWGTDSLYPAAELAAQHYRRNMYILANIDRMTRKGEKVLVIIGSGHRSVIKQFIKDKKDLDYKEIHKYLEE